ncbi:MAG TPA: RNA polymerase subunit sigma-70 [Desulfosporosinus sp.]|nr:RNA polymerase subunit sigma-70 [Desulfosporosinus sp.]
MAANAKTKKYLNSELFAEVQRDLLDQLERNGTFGKYYADLVGDYMDMWVTKCLLVDDIQRRGVTIKYDNGGGQKGLKKNDSIEQRIKINAQMLKLLAELGIKPAQSGGEEDDL